MTDETPPQGATPLDDAASRLRRAEQAFHRYVEGRGRGEVVDADEFLKGEDAEIRDELAQLLDDYQLLLGGEAPKDEAAFGPYRRVRKLGEGASGIVWEAEESSLRRVVALKLLRPHFLLSDRARARFEREAVAGARLRHPGIVAIHASGVIDGTPYIAQELIAGGRSLSTWIDEQDPKGHPRTRTLDALVRLFAEITDAAAYAHAEGVVHRDLKPSNILLTSEFHGKLADFGLATLADDASVSLSGESLGTPRYMSPEQAVGKPMRLDARTDVFSLGATLYECLVLRPPFAGQTREDVVHAILLEEPVDLRRLQPSLPADLCAVVGKALEKDRADRYGSMRAFGDDLRRWLNGQPVRARPLGPLRRAVRVVRRHPRWTAALIALIVLTTVGGAAAWTIRETTRRSLERSRYQQLLGRADVELGHGRVRSARDYLEQCEPRLRAWEWRQLRLGVDSSVQSLAAPESAFGRGFALHPSGESCATVVRGVGQPGAVQWRSLSDGAVLRSFPLEADEGAMVAFAEDGSRLAAYGEVGRVRVWDLRDAGHEPMWSASCDALPESARALVFVDDSLLAIAGGTQVELWDVESGQRRSTLMAGADEVLCLDIDASGTRIAAGTTRGRLWVWDRTREDQPWFDVANEERDIVDIVWRPGTTQVASLQEHGVVRLHSVVDDGSVVRERIWRESMETTSLEFSERGHLLLVASADDAIQVLDAERGAVLLRLRGHEDGVELLRCDPSGASFWTSERDGTLRRWDGSAPRPRAPIPGGPGAYAHSADGKRLVTVADEEDGRLVLLRDATTWSVQRPLWGVDGVIRAAGFGRRDDRCWLATDSGLWAFTADGGLAAHFDVPSTSTVIDVAEGDERMLWRLDDGRVWWTDVDEARLGSFGSVVAIASDEESWWAADAEGVLHQASETGAWRRVASLPTRGRVTALASQAGRVAWGTDQGEVGVSPRGAWSDAHVVRRSRGILDVAFDPAASRLAVLLQPKEALGEARRTKPVEWLDGLSLDVLWTDNARAFVDGVSVSADGSRLLTRSMSRGRPVLWPDARLSGSPSLLRRLDVDPEAERLAREAQKQTGFSSAGRHALDQEGLDQASDVLDRLGDDPVILLDRAWSVFLRSVAAEDVDEEAVGRALRWSDAASRTAPHLPGVASVQSALLWRLGRSMEATRRWRDAQAGSPLSEPERAALALLLGAVDGLDASHRDGWMNGTDRAEVSAPLRAVVDALFPE